MRSILVILGMLVAPSASVFAASSFQGVARAVDGDTLAFGRQRVRLWGIDAPELRQPCADRAGQSWACGAAARRALAARIAGVDLVCAPRDRDDYGRPVATCTAGGEDLARWIVETGWAFDFARYSGGTYRADEQRALAARRAIWTGSVTAPWLWRAAHREAVSSARVEPAAPSPACPFKGNINAAGARIVHAPGQRDYAAVKIDGDRGERCFCSLAAARVAGWRPAAR